MCSGKRIPERVTMGVFWNHPSPVHPSSSSVVHYSLLSFLPRLFISPHLSPPVSRVHLLFSPPLFLSHLPSIISSVFPPHSSLSCLRGDSSLDPYLYCDSPYPLGSCIYLCGLLLAQVLGKIEILLPPSISGTCCLLLLGLGQSTCSETLL